MGEEGVPQGVVMEREPMGVKPESCWRPVPPITAMWTGPREQEGGGQLGIERIGGGEGWMK